MKRAVAVLLALALLTSLSGCDASWFCKKGKPCGKACIAKHLDCHQ